MAGLFSDVQWSDGKGWGGDEMHTLRAAVDPPLCLCMPPWRPANGCLSWTERWAYAVR